MTKQTGCIDSCKTVELTRLEFLCGLGIDEDPVRVVTQWWTHEGEIIAERDELLREEAAKTEEFLNFGGQMVESTSLQVWKQLAIDRQKDLDATRQLLREAKLKLAVRPELDRYSEVLTQALVYRNERDEAREQLRLIDSENNDLLKACKLALGAFENNNAIDWNILQAAIDRSETRQKLGTTRLDNLRSGAYGSWAGSVKKKTKPDCWCVKWYDERGYPTHPAFRHVGSWEGQRAEALIHCADCHGTGYKPKRTMEDVRTTAQIVHDAAMVGSFTEEKLRRVAPRSAPLRLLVEVVPEKDEEHAVWRWSHEKLGVDVVLRDMPGIIAGLRGMSVTELPAIPSLPRLAVIYCTAFTKEYRELPTIPPELSLGNSLVVMSCLKEVLSACGLEVTE